ncbi:hypothetical protein MHYP_G00103620 [Metynnis hypsauchen]
MKILLIFTLFLISAAGGESERVTGYSGGGVLIKCRYETQYTTNPKYLCKDSWLCTNKPIWTDDINKWINSGRFSLFDDTRASQFWVLIRELTVEDSGKYNCAVWKSGIDVFTPVELKVEEDQNYEKRIDVVGHVGGGVNISCKYPQSHKNNPKFLCRRVGSADCSYETSVKKSRRWINEGKLHLHDDGKQIFTVSFNRLTEGDSGEYWCGAESDWTSDHGYKVYITQINLRVTGTASPTTSPSSSAAQTIETNASTTTKKPSFKTLTEILPQSSTYISSLTTKPTTSSTSKTTSSSLSASASSVTTGVAVILMLLLTGLLFLILCLQKRGKIQDPDITQSQSLRGFSVVHRVFPAFIDHGEITDSRHLLSSDADVSTVIYTTSQLPTSLSEHSQTVYDDIHLHSSCDFSNAVYSTVH